MNKTATYRPTQYYYSAAGQKLMTEVSTDPALGGSIVAEKTRIYLSAMVLKGGEIEFLGTAEGRALSIESLHKNPDGEVSLPNYIDASSNQFRYEYQLKDHLGNLRVACRCGDPIRKTNGDIAKNNQNREPIRIVQQNPVRSFGDAWGLDFGTSIPIPEALEGGVEDRFQYNSKERIQDLGIEMYDYGARHYDAAVGRWSSVDPAAGLMRRISPYAYAFNNPIRFTDPDGMVPGDFLNEKGENIGNDGIGDGKVYVIKTTESEFDSGVPSAGITKDQANQTEKFISENSGNTEAFQNNSIAYDNSVEIEGSADVRGQMVNAVSGDNGKGGTKDANNREYGGEISIRGEVTVSTPGSVSDPSVDNEARVTHQTYGDDTRTTFHSHPSGSKSITTGGGANTIGGSSTTTYGFGQAPSSHDVGTAGSSVEYVFGKGSGKVYIYNNQGVQATIPEKRFVNPKR